MILNSILHYLGIFFGATWWFWLFIFSIFFLRSSWLAWRQQSFRKSQKYVICEIKIPREITRSPKAMDQLFMAVHQMQNGPANFGEKYFDGEVGRTFTFEMVSFSGEIHFYVRFYHKYRGLIQGAFYSAYPDVELIEIEDYNLKFPKTYADLEAAGYDLWGTELQLTKKLDMYPIKTYVEFETMMEEAQFDPISVLVETMTKLKPGEFIGVQYIVDALEPRWVKEFEEDLNELKKPKMAEAPTEGEFGMMQFRSPGETDVLKAVERKLSKPAFETMIRFIYISPKPTFYDSFPRRAITSTYNQYAANDLNSFKQNHKYVSPMAQIWYFPYVFSNTRNKLRKQRLWKKFCQRIFPSHIFMAKLLDSHPLSFAFHSETITLTADELATLYHPPTKIVLTAPHVERVVSKKGGPPAGLPIYGAEEELKQFKKE